MVEEEKKEYKALLKRFRHLLESDIIRMYDEVDSRTGEYKRNPKELDKYIEQLEDNKCCSCRNKTGGIK
jgi:hypothetical protein